MSDATFGLIPSPSTANPKSAPIPAVIWKGFATIAEVDHVVHGRCWRKAPVAGVLAGSVHHTHVVTGGDHHGVATEVRDRCFGRGRVTSLGRPGFYGTVRCMTYSTAAPHPPVFGAADRAAAAMAVTVRHNLSSSSSVPPGIVPADARRPRRP